MNRDRAFRFAAVFFLSLAIGLVSNESLAQQYVTSSVPACTATCPNVPHAVCSGITCSGTPGCACLCQTEVFAFDRSCYASCTNGMSTAGGCDPL